METAFTMLKEKNLISIFSQSQGVLGVLLESVAEFCIEGIICLKHFVRLGEVKQQLLYHFR